MGYWGNRNLTEASNAIHRVKAAETTVVGSRRFDVLNVPRQAVPNSGELYNVERNKE